MELLSFTHKLSDYCSLLKATFHNFVLKPKHHIFEHYPHLIRCFGPLIDLWTMRFISKQGLFKKVARDVHNTKNLLFSLAIKHQQLMAYHLDGQSLFKSDINTEKVKTVQVSSLDSSSRNAVLTKFPNADTVNIACKVQLFGTEYAQNMILMAGQSFGQPDFFKILSIVICPDRVSFLSKKLTAWYFEHYRSFKIEDSDYAELIVLDADELSHYYPLTAYSVGGKLLVTLRARLYKKKWLVCILKFIITDDPSARVSLVDTTVFFVCQALLMRVVISKDEARRVQLSQVPETVNVLIDVVKGKFSKESFHCSLRTPISKMQSVICQRFQSYPIVVQSYLSSGKTLSQTNMTASLLVPFLPWTL